jgi:hypothetical protein
MPTVTKGSRIDISERIEAAEELLCAGLSPGRVERKLSQDYGISTRQARTYIARVYERWEEQITADAPHRREKVYRMAERFYAKALIDKQYTAASNTLHLLAKLSGALQQESNRENPLATLGPLPTDPTEALIYAQKAMIVALSEVVANPNIDPERRLRWISEIGGKIGMTHAKALMQAKLARVTKTLAASKDISGGPQLISGIVRPATARGGAGGGRGISAARHLSDPPSSEDE